MPLLTVPVLHVAPATPRSRLLSLALPEAFTFLPGQALELAAHESPDRRAYSIACSPERARETGRLEVLVGSDGTEAGSAHIPVIRSGALVDIDGPFGTFIFPEPPTQPRLLFIAGGTGIAPLRAMLDHALRHHPSEQVSLLYSARRRDEFSFIDEFRQYEREGRLELHQTVTRDDSTSWLWGRGRIGRSHFEAVLHDRLRTLCFVCGPAAMVAESVATLRELGVPGAAIRTEEWQRPGMGQSEGPR